MSYIKEGKYCILFTPLLLHIFLFKFGISRKNYLGLLMLMSFLIG